MRVSCSDRKPTGGVGTAQVTHKYFEEDGKIGEGEGGKEERRGGEGGGVANSWHSTVLSHLAQGEEKRKKSVAGISGGTTT